MKRICMYENDIMKPIILHAKLKNIKMKKIRKEK